MQTTRVLGDSVPPKPPRAVAFPILDHKGQVTSIWENLLRLLAILRGFDYGKFAPEHLYFIFKLFGHRSRKCPIKKIYLGPDRHQLSSACGAIAAVRPILSSVNHSRTRLSLNTAKLTDHR